MIYLLDTNTLIEAKNRYYRMSFCPGYWAWIEAGGASGMLASVASVGAELRRGNDDLASWASANSALFLGESDTDTQSAFASVAVLVAGQASRMKPGGGQRLSRGCRPRGSSPRRRQSGLSSSRTNSATFTWSESSRSRISATSSTCSASTPSNCWNCKAHASSWPPDRAFSPAAPSCSMLSRTPHLVRRDAFERRVGRQARGRAPAVRPGPSRCGRSGWPPGASRHRHRA